MIAYYHTPGLMWVRILGVGFLLKDVRRHPSLFSERTGYWWQMKIGPFVLRYLPRFT